MTPKATPQMPGPKHWYFNTESVVPTTIPVVAGRITVEEAVRLLAVQSELAEKTIIGSMYRQDNPDGTTDLCSHGRMIRFRAMSRQMLWMRAEARKHGWKARGVSTTVLRFSRDDSDIVVDMLFGFDDKFREAHVPSKGLVFKRRADLLAFIEEGYKKE